MHYRLGNGLSYCQVDGTLVFLDLEQDRYFQLPRRLARALVGALTRRDCPVADVNVLVEKGILVASTEEHSSLHQAPALPRPKRSALEIPPAQHHHASAVIGVGFLVASTRFQLGTRPLARLLASVVERRDRLTGGATAVDEASSTCRILQRSAMFHRSRGYVPIEPCCLLDSIALVRFLARHGLHADITFGVTLDPFAAHCWVQSGEWVLNDSVGNAIAHTPIRSF